MYLTKKLRNLEMKSLESKVAKFKIVQKVYRSGNVSKGKTWMQICEEYESLLTSYIRYDYLTQCTYTSK
tara:strand:- start:1 stop:207 length:207 start_codon:yes stop_codon:yes gene_type:complete